MQFFVEIAAAFSVFAAVVQAAPSPNGDQPPSRVVDKRASTCTPTAGGSSSTDDVPHIESAIAACPSGTIVIPASTTYYVNSQLSFAGCVGCTFKLEGTLKVASDTSYWEGKEQIIDINDIKGATITGSGLIDANGQDAYDLLASDSSYSRVKAILRIEGSSSGITVSGITMKNPPNTFNGINSGTSDITFSSVTLTAASKSTNAPKNTDGFDISGKYVTIEDTTVTNQDDCVALGDGAEYITVTNIKCSGSHGLSVGSLGKSAGVTDTVQNVIFNGATMTDCGKAGGIKLWPGGYGSAVVTNVTWENIVVDSCDYAFQVQSCYENTASYCSSNPCTAKLTDIVVKGFSGTTDSKYEPAVANIDCPADGTCGLTLSDMTVKPPSGTAEYLCANAGSIGVTCTSGASG